MRIALTMRITEAPGTAELRDAISHDWLARLAAWDMTPVPVPNILAQPEAYLDGLGVDLLVLTGGDDLGVTPERDATESRLLAHAVGKGLAVLGVCRGMQLINHHLGGRLSRIDDHVACSHDIVVEPVWRDLYDGRTTVNSFHALGIPADGLAEGLAAAAFDSEGHVEAFHHRTKPLAGVMWHPERPDAPAEDRRLIESLTAEGAFWT